MAAWLAASRAARVSVGQIRGGAAGPAGRRPRVMTPATRGDDSLDLYRDGYRHFEDSAAFAAYVNSGYERGRRLPGRAPGAGTAAREDRGAEYGGRKYGPAGTARGHGRLRARRARATRARGLTRPGGIPAEAAGFHADPVEPVTGAFDPLFRPNGSAAPAREPAGAPARRWPA